MKRFQNILFVIQGSEIAESAFQQAAVFTQSTNANISFLVLHPDLPANLQDVQKAYEENIRTSIKTKLQSCDMPQDANIYFETASPHFVTIIQYVLKKDFDLVIKAAEELDDKQNKGFKSLDMSLLRKCPCTVWLCRDWMNADKPRVLTAIDPFSDAPEGRDLSVKLLQIGNYFAESMGGANTVISCWEFEHEGFLRNSPFAKIEGEKVDVLVGEAQKNHDAAVQKLISEMEVSTASVICERGKAYDVIPSYAEREGIDIVIMGTVARTGIPGFLIGNTAENIVQNLSCGMFAVKPGGFVSPIKAY